MRIKGHRLIALILVLVISFQFAGCTGKTKKPSSNPAEFMETFESAVKNLDRETLLSLMLIDSGSSRYKEYDEILNLSSYTDEAEKCYKGVASNIDIKYNESDIENSGGIAKVKVKFTMPKWEFVFGDISLRDADAVVDALSKIEKVKTEMTLRLIETKDGLKVKNADEFLELFDFVGAEIVIYSRGMADPTTEPTEPTEPVPTPTPEPTATPMPEPPESRGEPSEPDPTEPSESGTAPTEPSEATTPSKKSTEPSSSSKTTKKGTDSDKAAAYAAYAKLIEKNKAGIEWYEKTFNSNACGLIDINGDSIPELYFFTQSEYSSNYVNFFIYTFNPTKGRAVLSLIETLTEAGSKISEFFVLKTKDNKIVSYRGYVDTDSSILTYSIYKYDSSDYMAFCGNMFCTITPSFEGSDGKSKNVTVCTISGVDKYKTGTNVEIGEFRRVEKALLNSSTSLFSAQFQKDKKSAACNILGSKKFAGSTYAALAKKLASK